jgi:hypothetical protein
MGRFRQTVASGKADPGIRDLMGAAAKRFAELSVDAWAILVGPHLQRADGSTGVYVVFTHPEAIAHATWAELLPAMPPGALTEASTRLVADRAHVYRRHGAVFHATGGWLGRHSIANPY